MTLRTPARYTGRLLQFLLTSPNARGAPEALQQLVMATSRMPEPTRALWSARFSHLYGDLAGQRAVDVGALRARVGAAPGDATGRGALFGVQTYFALIADILSAGAAHPNSAAVVGGWSRLSAPELSRFLRRLSSGEVLAGRGVHGAASAFDLDWYVDALDAPGVESVRALLAGVALQWEDVERAADRADPMSGIYTKLLPRNLLHALGEVYTPGWLAELAIEDSEWSPGQRLIDPFAGSGVFALAALRLAARSRAEKLDVLPDLCLIDINPFACVAARANLILALRRELQSDSRSDVYLPILSGDALAPALLIKNAASNRGQPGVAPQLAVDGQLVDLPLDQGGGVDVEAAASALTEYGVRLPRWLHCAPTPSQEQKGRLSARDRRSWEQLAILALTPADVVVTNPPWVGWEYIARPYRAYLDPAWSAYGLFSAKGRDASFLKEDLSTLALITAWDRYLVSGGTSVAVLRSSTMLSTLAARGLRRLSIFPASDPLRLDHVRLFDGERVFSEAHVGAATWRLTKGQPTKWPVPVDRMSTARGSRRTDPGEHLADVRARLSSSAAVVERVSPDDATSRWLIGTAECVRAAAAVSGKNAYIGRTGVFTGGANAVYYLRPSGAAPTSELAWFTNVTKGAKRSAPASRIQVEPDLLYEVVRGRDLTRWRSQSGALLLFPHTKETRMRALPPATLASRYPKAFAYLTEMRAVLDQRRGFTEWERDFRDEAFYAIQRVGDYTFAPYKVAWRYIADDFLVAVVGPDAKDRPRLPNDKVMFVGLDDEREAFYLCGVLSSDPIRWKVTAYASGTQISATAIEPLRVERFREADPLHVEIAQACRAGHLALARGELARASSELARINVLIARLFGFDEATMLRFRAELTRARRADWPPLRAKDEGAE